MLVTIGCEKGIELDWSGRKPAPRLIYNNTICFCSEYGVGLDDFSGGARIFNNIVWKNKIGFRLNGDEQEIPDTIAYNLVYDNTNGNFVDIPYVGLGQKLIENVNGDSADVYLNIMMDPEFMNDMPPHLSAESPCHGAGAPFLGPLIGFDSSLICEQPVSVTANIAAPTYSDIAAKVVPNPASDRCTIMLTLSRSSHITVTLVALDGSTLERTVIGALPEGTQSVNLDLTTTNPGRYWVVVDAQPGFGRGLTESPLRRVLPLSVVR